MTARSTARNGSAMRSLGLLLFVWAGAAWAQDGPRVTAAVGLIEKASGACSGVLVAPDLVLTAAHCLFGEVDGQNGDLTGFTFRTGAYPAHPSISRGVNAVLPHPLFMFAKRAGQDELRYDYGLMRLESPIPTSVAIPLDVADVVVGPGDSVLLASWPRGQGKRARERRCPVLQQSPNQLLVECVVVKGESGSPVLGRRGDEWVVLGVMVATTRIEGRPAGLAVRRIPERLDALQIAMDPS